MRAVVKTGGKQYSVSPGDRISVEKIEGNIGDAVTLSEVLLVASDDGSPKIGTPLLSGVKVKAKILSHVRGDKVITFKKRIKTGYTKKQGHRQEQTQLLIESISQ